MTQKKSTKLLSWNQLKIGDSFRNQKDALFQKDSDTKLKFNIPGSRTLYWTVNETIKNDKVFIKCDTLSNERN